MGNATSDGSDPAASAAVGNFHYILCSCPYQDDGQPGHWQQQLQNFCGLHDCCHYAIVDSTTAKLAETKDDDFVKAWKAGVLSIFRNLESKEDIEGVMFVLVHGGGKGCELERRNIIPLIKDMLEVKNKWNNQSTWPRGLALKYVKWDDFAARVLTSNAPNELLLCDDYSELTLGGDKTVKFSVLNCGLQEFDGDYTECGEVGGKPSYCISTGGVQTCHYWGGKWFLSYDCAGVRYQAQADERYSVPPKDGWEAVGHGSAAPQVSLPITATAFLVQGCGEKEFVGRYEDARHESDEKKGLTHSPTRTKFFRMTGGKAPTCVYNSNLKEWYLVNDFMSAVHAVYKVPAAGTDVPPTHGWERGYANGKDPMPTIVHDGSPNLGGVKAPPIPLTDFTYDHGWILTGSL